MRLDLVDDRHQRCSLLVAALGFLVQLFPPPLDRIEIREDQLCGNCLDISHGIDAALNVMDVVVLEAADHVNDGIDFTDVAQKLVAEPFAGGGAFHQPCDINELHGSQDQFRRA